MAGPAFGVVDRDTPYAVTVANRGPSAAAGVTVTDVIPSGARFVRSEGAATCTPGATVRCTLPTIAPGASGVLTVVLAGTAEGASFHHAVSVTTTSTDPTPGRPQRVGRHARDRARASRRPRSRSGARRA